MLQVAANVKCGAERGVASLSPVRWDRVRLLDGMWKRRTTVNREVTLSIAYAQCVETGRIGAFRLDWRPGMPNQPHHFWDSDVAKWVEATAYSLATHPDAALRKQLDQVVDLIVKAQQPDGYLNVYFTVVEPGRRWTNLRDMHELYCAGHLMEAAVAVYHATGSRKLLDAMCRYADHIHRVIGPEPGQIPGYAGHAEIELALMKLYHATGEARYLNLGRYFVEQRGRSPHFFRDEAVRRGADPSAYDPTYSQSHAPIREQKDADGHVVRALYLYSGAVDLAMATGDASLHAAMRNVWDSIVRRRMYVTGGVGSTIKGERFTFDYDLPNETAYAETCAAIALVFFAHRMLQVEVRAEYADVLERALYNGVVSGVNLRGDRYFYANPLRSSPALLRPSCEPHASGRRQQWFGCACCPPNLARLLASLGGYIYATDADTLYVHQYIASQASVDVRDARVEVRMQTDYPWDESVRLTMMPAEPLEMTLALRVPGWCPRARLTINDAPVNVAGLGNDGYLRISRRWTRGDTVELVLEMPIQRVYAHPACRSNIGKVALQRGPLVYCVEEVDCGCDPGSLWLPGDAPLTARYEPDTLHGTVVIEGRALACEPFGRDDALYSGRRPTLVPTFFKAIPYALWGNRREGGMAVWLNEGTVGSDPA